MLIDHDSVLFESSIAVTIKFLGKEPFRMAKWICRIVDDDVVIIFTISQKSQSILVVNGDAEGHQVLQQNLGSILDKPQPASHLVLQYRFRSNSGYEC